MFAVLEISHQPQSHIFIMLEVMSKHGIPAEILSDRGRAISSVLMKEILASLGFNKLSTSDYHLQTDSLDELRL